jgi:hypothetical protein
VPLATQYRALRFLENVSAAPDLRVASTLLPCLDDLAFTMNNHEWEATAQEACCSAFLLWAVACGSPSVQPSPSPTA